MDPITDFLQQSINGLAVGCIYALVGLGFVLIYKATHVVNFAQGEILMIGAFLFFTFSDAWKFDFWVSAVLAILCTSAIGGLLYYSLLRRIPEHQVIPAVIITIGIGIIARNGVRLIPEWGSDTHTVSTPFSSAIVSIGGLAIGGDHLGIMIATAVLIAGLQIILVWTKPGLAIRALSQDRTAVRRLGVPVTTFAAMVWALSGGISGLAGVLFAPVVFIHPEMGYLALRAFSAAVLGGFVSIPGTVVGGIVVGVAEELAGFYLPEGIKSVTPHLILIAALLMRPRGFLSAPNIRKA